VADEFPDLPSVGAFGDALVDAARADQSLPSIDAFGRDLVRRTRRRDRRRARWRGVVLGALVALPIAATSGAATAVVLREAVVTAPDPAQVPDEQTPLAGTARVIPLRAKDPGGGLPWALRVARGKTGFTCTTVGQVKDGTFGLTGLDRVFRRLPGELSDTCGQGGTLTGARLMAADKRVNVRSIVYGVAGAQLAAVTLTTAKGDRPLEIGPGGTYITALRGYPEDSLAGLVLRFRDGRTERHAFGASKENIPDPEGAQAWAVDRFVMGTRYSCAHVREARMYGENRITSPTACLGLRASERDWVADAHTLHPGDRGVPGFDRWDWRSAPARTVVWGTARTNKAITKVVLNGAGAPRELAITGGAFAAVLPASVDPAALTLDVTLRDGTVEHGKPGDGLLPDLVPSRRTR
jgi:hypothetical protein